MLIVFDMNSEKVFIDLIVCIGLYEQWKICIVGE